MHYPRIKYEFVNNTTGEVFKLPEDPKGWDTSERNIKRSVTNFSLVREYSKNLEFHGKSARKLEEYYRAYDIEADISLIEYRLIPYTTVEQYYIHTKGELDFSEYSKKDRAVKVPFRTGGLEKQIAAQLTEKFDIQRQESITGVDIGEMNLIDVALTSREILLISQIEATPNDLGVFSGVVAASSNFSMLGPPRVPNLTVISNSDEENVGGSYGADAFLYDDSTAEQFFFRESNAPKTIRVRVQYDIRVHGGGFNTVNFQPFLRRFSFDGSDYTDEQTYVLANPSGTYLNQRRFTGDYEVEIELDEDDSVLLGFSSIGGDSPTTGYSQSLQYYNLRVTVTEDSPTPQTNTKGTFIHDLMNRLCQITTGRNNAFYSEVFGRTDLGYASNGKYAFHGITLGLWIRQFFERSLETSFKEALKSCDAIHNVTYGIYEIDGVEKMVLEELEFFFQDQEAIDLGEVNEYEEKVAKEFYYRGLEVGYAKPDGERLYEEAMGLDEFNVKSTWTLPITRSEDTFSKLSDYRNDSYGKAFASRKPKLNYPEEDTRYDQDKFFLDLKTGAGLAYLEKTWQDYYEEIPTGVYSPNTATGVGFTPFRNMQRHEFLFASGLLNNVYQDKFIRFASNNGNKELITKVAGEQARPEKGNKLISEATRSRIYPLWYEFEKKVDYRISQLLDGYKEINGRKIPNIFFKVKFVHDNEVKYGYIFEVKPDGKGKWKLLKAV